MVAEDYLLDPDVRTWLDGVEPAWMLLTFDSLRALRREPSAKHAAIQIANNLSVDEIAGSAVARRDERVSVMSRPRSTGGVLGMAIVDARRVEVVSGQAGVP